MKRIITEGVPEQFELLCDVTGKPAVARLVMAVDYGSRLDDDGLDVDLSEEVAEEVLKLLRSKYPQFEPRERGSGVLAFCPWCGRAH